MSTDYTPIGPVPSGIANGTVDSTSKQLARDMRGKAYGKDVRETIARMTEWHSIRSSAAEVLAAQSAASAKASEASAKVSEASAKQSAQNVTQNAQNSIKLFNDAIRQQSQKIDNMVVDFTDYDFDSAPEIVAARRGKPSLGAKIDEIQDFQDATGFSLASIIKQFNLEPIPDPVIVENLWNPNETVLGSLSETSGNVNSHATNRTTEFIEIESDTPYSFYSERVFKVVWFDVNQNFIDGYGWQSAGEVYTFTSPENAAYMRMTITITGSDDYAQILFIANIGTEILDPDNEGGIYDGDFWDNVPTPPLTKDSVKTYHMNDKAVTIEKLDDEIAEVVRPTRIVLENLWNVESSTTGTLNESNGNLNPHELNRVSGFISVEPGATYSFMMKSPNGFKVVWFDESENYVDGLGWQSPRTQHVFEAPGNAAYMRLNLSVSASNPLESAVFIVNIGEEVLDEGNIGKVVYDSFWDKQPSGVIEERLLSPNILDSITVVPTTRPLQPFPKKLNFTEISTGWQEVNHLSQDGEVVYFKRGYAVEQSLNDGETIEPVGTIPEVPSIQAIRDLADGELLVSTTRDESTGLKSKVYKTVGYDRYNPENTQFVEVLEAISSQANIYASWGLETHDNICLASEYGLRGDNGARHVYLSTDYGDTWNVIFDQKTTTESIEGAPTWTTSAHLHTVHYDRYGERIWLVVGDAPNSATYYSDDLGESWKFVDNPIDMQYTGIVSYPEGVVFGSDRGPNGLYVWRRTQNKTDSVIIEPLMIINDDPTITHVFQRPFRRYAEKDELTLFPATRASSSTLEQGSVIMGFTGINNPYLMHELENATRTGFYNVVGVTAKGNILTSYHNSSNHSILRAKAPLWE